MLYVMFMLFSAIAFGDANWLCVDSSSELRGDGFYACGVGYGGDKSVARSNALKSAREEFKAICDENTECGQRQYLPEPKRTSCDKVDTGWVCYRLIVYHQKKALRHIASTTTQHIASTIQSYNEPGWTMGHLR